MPRMTVSGVPTRVVPILTPSRSGPSARAGGRTAQGVLEVGHGLVPLAVVDLAQRLLVVVGDVHVDHQPPVLPVHGLAVLGRGLLRDLPRVGGPRGPAGQAGAE